MARLKARPFNRPILETYSYQGALGLFADFFIQRPVFSTVTSLFIVIAGAVCIPFLPIAQFPQLAPPQIAVSSVYIGANATAVESSVTTILEQAINGVEGMRYMSSTSGNDGSSSINIT